MSKEQKVLSVAGVAYIVAIVGSALVGGVTGVGICFIAESIFTVIVILNVFT